MKKISFISILFFIFLSVGQMALAVNDDMIYFSGPASALAPESNFTVSVLVDANKPINAIDFLISYPPDKLKFLNFDNTYSIVDLWQTKFETAVEGEIVLIGGMMQPFNGQNGLIIKLNFQALSVGQPKLAFEKSNVYISDGKGTKLSVDSPAFNISISQNAPKISAVSSSKSLNPANMVDSSPPEIFLEETISPVDGSTLIVFNATDADSGIKETQMRFKKWWAFSAWTDVTNPVLRPDGVWSVEFKAVNNVGLGSIKTLSWQGELYKKILLSFSPALVLLILILWVYNKKRQKI